MSNHSKIVSRVLEVDYHRNGIGGVGFHIVRFLSDEASGEFLAILFPEQGECAVLNMPELAKGNIAFAHGNSWRGDHFEAGLREAVKQYQIKTYGKELT